MAFFLLSFLAVSNADRRARNTLGSNAAVTPRTGYSTFCHVAATPRFHALEAQNVIFAAVWRHVSGFALRTCFVWGNVFTFRFAAATELLLGFRRFGRDFPWVSPCCFCVALNWASAQGCQRETLVSRTMYTFGHRRSSDLSQVSTSIASQGLRLCAIQAPIPDSFAPQTRKTTGKNRFSTFHSKTKIVVGSGVGN